MNDELRRKLNPGRSSAMTPLMTAILCWLLDLPPQTCARPGSPSLGRIISLATTGDGFLLANEGAEFIGKVAEFEENLRRWCEACGVSDAELGAVQDALDRKVVVGPGCRRPLLKGVPPSMKRRGDGGIPL